MESYILIDGVEIPVVHKKSLNRRSTISFKITKEGLIISTPIIYDKELISHFLETKKTWIYKNRLKTISLLSKPRQFITGETLLYKGKEYKLFILKFNDKKSKIVFDKHYFWIYVNKMYLSNQISEIVKKIVNKRYLSHAIEYIEQRVLHFSTLNDLKVERIFIKNYKSKYGQCSKHDLYFNFNIIKFPTNIIDHIILHELAHIKYKNHGSKFRTFLRQIDENCDENNNRLKENGIYLI